MNNKLRWAACLAVGMVALAGSGRAVGDNAPPPAEAFGALPEESDVVLSPDGHWLAWADHREAKPHIVMFDLVARKPQRILAIPRETKLRGLDWNDNQTLLITVSETVQTLRSNQTSREYFLTTAYDVGGGEGRMLPEASGRQRGARAAITARLLLARTAKPHTVIMESRAACHGDADCVFSVDTMSGKAELIKAGNHLTSGWVVDQYGKAIAREDWDWKKSMYRVYALSSDSIKEILSRPDTDRPSLAGLLPDDSALVLLASNGRSHQAAWELPLDGSPPRLLAEDPDGDITGTYTDPYTGAIIGVYVDGTKTRIHWLDTTAEHRYEVVKHAFAGREVSAYGWTADGTKTLARVESPSTPPIFYLVDFATHHADIAGEEYPALANVTLGTFKQITYKARDGTSIPAFLTTPPGKAGPGPLVVLPHGGPTARDYPQFDWLVQFLASRGYSVLQPEFRGSTGFGDAYRDAGYKQWGGLMQDDVTDGVRAMIDQKIADPQHVCIVGASYGGYAALAGAAFTPELYACAASIEGISDLRALLQEVVPIAESGPFFGTVTRYYSTALDDWTAHVGAPTDPNLVKHSPINSIATIKAPVFIAYGTGDGVVPISQSQRMAEALKAAGKPVTVVQLPGEDHWLSRGETRTQLLKELDAFLKQYL